MDFIVNKCEKIYGEIRASGSKNAALPIIVASLLIKEKVVLKNIPFIKDVIGIIRILESIGAKVKYDCNNGYLEITSKKINYKVDSKYVSKIRASYYLMGVLISRKKYFEIDYPGGCNFEERPIDIHLDSFSKLNIKIEEKEMLKFYKEELIPRKIILKKVSVGATINIILATTISSGITIIENASIEPEVEDVINFLNEAGACINIINKNIIIKGVDKLKSVTYTIMGDRIEAGSYLLLASCVPCSNLIVKKVNPIYMSEVINVLKRLGCIVKVTSDEILMQSPVLLKSINEEVDAYPSFPTDLQPILSTVLLKANGESIVKDNVYKKRISHIKELNKLSGNIFYENETIYINKSHITNGECISHDLRCGFALICAGVMSDDFIKIKNAENILRGYEDIINKLTSVGVTIKKIL